MIAVDSIEPVVYKFYLSPWTSVESTVLIGFPPDHNHPHAPQGAPGLHYIHSLHGARGACSPLTLGESGHVLWRGFPQENGTIGS
jgi:hypothetical protein